MRRVHVRSSQGAYVVSIGFGALNHKKNWPKSPSAGIVVSSKRIFALHGETFVKAAARFGHRMLGVALVRDGERAKVISQWERLQHAFAGAGLDRQSIVWALGGGSVGDVAGFAAATYLRGVRFAQIPTTLLAMVDSSVGGKTGVNIARGKNLIGAFHAPIAVLADTRFLDTLSPRERRSGAAEILKCGALGARRLLSLVERTGGLARATREETESAIAAAIRKKAAIVGRDERESGERRLLNLGHTVGHALEAATSYRRFTHGEAVLWGIAFAVAESVRRGLARERDLAPLSRALATIGPRPSLPAGSRARILSGLATDKKRDGASIEEPLFLGGLVAGLVRIETGEYRQAVADWLDQAASSPAHSGGHPVRGLTRRGRAASVPAQ
jgi:3-dehydroquinate synthase